MTAAHRLVVLLRLEARLPEAAAEDQEIKGRIVAKDFRLIEAPAFTKILSMASVTGLIDLMRKGHFKPRENVVFWHTGGTPALFAYREAFESLLGDAGEHDS